MEIRQLGSDRLKEAGSVLSDAFWNYEEVLHLLPDHARRTRVLPRYLTADCVDAIHFGTLFGAFHDKALVGVSAWLPRGDTPRAFPVGLDSSFMSSRCCRWSCPSFPEVWRGQKVKGAGHTHEPHIYLCVLGVSTRRQSSGAGTALVDAMVHEADTLGVGGYLTTTTASNVS
jgi:hypothetical protein